ncbi:MAG: hypothetical protein JO145_00480, partial [Acidobacteriaceae bacterium]|nr:hypothetical protein [Acidobacteriaceae bacterium]
MFSLWIQTREQRHRPFVQQWGPVLARAVLAGAIGFAIALSWYSRNFAAALEHARLSANARGYFYSHWIAADLSAGPSILVTIFAVIGIPVVIRRLWTGEETQPSLRAWILMLLLSITTALTLYASADKGTRYQVAWLTSFAALAVIAWYPLHGTKWLGTGPAAVAGLGILLSLHISFGILPLPRLIFGDLKLIDSRFALNTPSSYEDNVPANQRDYRFSEAENRIATDAATRFPAGYSAEACTTQSSLIFDHYYFDFLANARKHPVHYMIWWYHCSATGPQAADYIVHTKNFEQFATGTENFDYYPHVEEDVTWQIIPYKELFRLQGPAANAQLIVYVKKQL